MTDKSTTRFIVILICLAMGLLAAAYTFYLFLEVQQHGTNVDSFCAISETINCITVETSEYAVVLGVPIAVYGLEYYTVGLAILLLSFFGFRPLRRWQSLIFWMAVVSVPVITILAYLAFVVIGSICIVCCVVYLANLTMLIYLLIANRGRLRELAVEGPIEFFRALLEMRALKIAVAVFTVVALSQFFWMSPLLGIERGGNFDFQGLPVDGMSLGDPNAPIKIEEFTDFQCPFCGKAHNVMLELVKKYPGKIYLTHRDYPLDHNCNPYTPRPFHVDACRAAKYGRCAAKQNRFWPLDEAMFYNNKKLKKRYIIEYARKAGLNLKKLEKCITEPATLEAVLGDIHEGRKRGLSGTPSFFVNGELIVGYRPLEFWDNKVQKLLGLKPVTSSPKPSTAPNH